VQILANTYRQLGGRLLEEAQELEEEVLEVRRRTLGEEHPDTLRSMRNLVITYRQLRGRLKEAQEIEEKVRFVRYGRKMRMREDLSKGSFGGLGK
jgi:type II secretory pathway predicted ATPase ExeA